jgi:FHA domain
MRLQRSRCASTRVSTLQICRAEENRPGSANMVRQGREMADTTRQVHAPDDNALTHVVGGEERSALDEPLAPREAFLRAYPAIVLAARGLKTPAVIVVAVSPGGHVVDAPRALFDRDSLILGRHTQCGLRLPGSAVSLRHLAALVRFEEGRPVLRLWDLATGLRFVTEDGEESAALIATGPVYVAVAGYAVWFVPMSAALAKSLPDHAFDAFDALPPRVFLDRRSPSPERPSSPWPPRGVAGDDTCSFVTTVAPALLLGDDDAPEVAWGVLRLERGPLRQERGVSAERLERGILVGRYERCGLLLSDDRGEVSRVHVLLVRIGAEVWALHTASTNGLFRGDAAVEAEVLRDDDALTLGGDVTLRWRRAEHPDA